jgi:selenoprotein W-related protein
LADALKQKYGTGLKTVDLIPSSGGAFEVSLNGTLLYSKLETGQFPTTEQITTAMDAAA